MGGGARIPDYITTNMALPMHYMTVQSLKVLGNG